MFIHVVTRLMMHTAYAGQRWAEFFTEQHSSTTDFIGQEAILGYCIDTY